MDVHSVDITNDVDLDLAIQVALRRNLAVAWKKDEQGRMRFGWNSSDPGWNEMMSPCKSGDLLKPIQTWLLAVDYPPEPPIDGHCTKGYHLFTPPSIVHGDDAYTIFIVEPVWIEHHK